MSLFAINQQTEAKFGTGLPIYEKKEYQARFGLGEIDGLLHSNDGYWTVPNNRLPTTQFQWAGAPDNLALFEIVPTNGLSDGTPISLPLTEVNRLCLTSIDKDAWFINDDERTFTLDSGTYYMRFTFDTSEPLYSEEFSVGQICCNEPLLEIVSLGPETPNIDVTLRQTSTGTDAVVSLSTFDTPTTYTDPPATFVVNIAPDTSKNLVITLATANCGNFKQTYRLQYVTGPTVVTLTKIYP